MTTKTFGENGFRWFVGIVEDRDDPEKLGRVKIRIFDTHDDKTRVPKDDLPWAFILVSPLSSSSNNVGLSPVGLQVGSTVLGFYADGNECQIPIVMGSMHGVVDGKHDVHPLAREINNLTKNKLGPEPSSPYKAKYPFNKVFASESGHVVEFDDTPGKERVHLYHRTGTYYEIDEKGNKVEKTVSDDYEIVAGKKEVFVAGNVNVVVRGNVTMRVDGNYKLDIGGTCNVTSGGNMAFKAPRIDWN
jgi:hypothetical protein